MARTCGQGQGVGDECAEERAAHGQASICVSGCIELLLQAGVRTGPIPCDLLRLRLAAIENNHARTCQLQCQLQTDEYGDASRSVS